MARTVDSMTKILLCCFCFLRDADLGIVSNSYAFCSPICGYISGPIEQYR